MWLKEFVSLCVSCSNVLIRLNVNLEEFDWSRLFLWKGLTSYQLLCWVRMVNKLITFNIVNFLNCFCCQFLERSHNLLQTFYKIFVQEKQLLTLWQS